MSRMVGVRVLRHLANSLRTTWGLQLLIHKSVILLLRQHLPKFIVHLLHALQMFGSRIAHLAEARIAQVNMVDSVYLQ